MATGARHIVVVGGGYAGVMAANRAHNRLSGADKVTLISERDDMVHRVRLHEALAGREVAALPLSSLVGGDVAIRQARVTRIDAASRTVITATGESIVADAIIVALGSTLSTPVAGVREHAAWLASPESAARASRTLAALPDASPVVVVGGSLTALEVASEIAEAHPRLAVTMLASNFGPTLSPRGSAYAHEALAALGVRVREGARVRAVTAESVLLDDGEALPSMLTVWGGGFVPAGPSIESDLARDSHGRLSVNADLGAVGHEGVFVAGDAAGPPPGMSFMRMGCASAMPMGAHAADNAVQMLRGRGTEAHRFGFFVQCASLGRARGLVQSVAADDSPVDRVVTGRAGAVIKESINRFVVGMIRAERMVTGAYRWPRSLQAHEAAA